MRNLILRTTVVVALLTACSGETKDDLLQSGIAQLQAGNTRGAVVFLRQALERDPNFFEARYQLGVAYLQNKQYEQAEHEFGKVDRQYAGFDDLLLYLAEIYRQTDRPELTIDALDRYHQNHPATSPSTDLLGVAQALMGQFPAADANFKKAAQLDPKNPLPIFHLAQSCLSQTKTQEAVSRLEGLQLAHPAFTPTLDLLAEIYLTQNRIDDAIAAYKHLFSIDPANIKALHMRGLLLLSLGRLEEAPEILDLFAARFPEDYRGQQLQGMAAYTRGDYDQALVFLLRSLKMRPHALTYYYLGLSHFRNQEYELAINQYQHILDEQPGSTQARLMLAMTFLLQQRVEDCLQQTRLALKVDPQNGLAYNLLGSAYLQQHDYDKAIDAFSHALEIDPELIELHLKKSSSHILRGEADLAEKELVVALDKSPQVLNTRLILASYHVLQQDDAGAVTVLKAGLRGTADDAPLYTFLAGIVNRQNRQEAIRYLQKALAADPVYRTPYYELANLYLLQGEYKQVTTLYSTLLARYPDEVRALVELGLAYELAGLQSEAQHTFERLAALDRTDACLEYASYQMRQNNEVAAAASLDRGLKQTGDDRALLRARIDLLLRQNRPAEAAPFLARLENAEPGARDQLLVGYMLSRQELSAAKQRAETVRKSRPDSAQGDLLLASVLETGGELQSALALISARLEVEPQDPDLRLRKGLLQEKRGDTDQAMTTYRDLIRLSPRYVPAHFALGTLFDLRGDSASARRCYQKALACDAGFVPAMNNLAYLEAAANRPDEALLLAFKAFHLAPGEAGVLDTLGVALLHKQRGPEAARVLERARNLSGSNPSICYHLAQAYIALRRQDLARTELQRALGGGDFPEAAQCRALLQQLRS